MKMVHTRNRSNYSVQPDGCGKGRGKTKSRSTKSSSRKTHLEDARVATHSPRSVPKDFDVNSESELINGNKLLAGGHELLITHQELCGSGEDHRTLRRLEPIVLQRQAQKDKELVEEPKSFINRPEERVGNNSSFGNRGPSGVYQLQTSSRSVQGQAQGTSEDEERSQEASRKGQRRSKLGQPLPTRVQDPQIGASSHG
ncbi:hypothetical protein O181_105706 [Austropuccinia psidii MF-1]|uniref:Uncharacterized protein n=1 Tax=Austropuccinia psidii MF-1 TaxID=1389203 RepID=A0A9Q3JQ05_9BASI|nr:hypothetical protein [Austropuccinia psidii MF-1]